ncbi:GNAT family N-acetyltransferase [Streptomyces sp. NPDC047880]|uniref:GNAT family N-acetyltransferase n=1 Tax=Streptomyces sp. NPDC047880 TaxID=3155626 RepID=UPI0034534464
MTYRAELVTDERGFAGLAGDWNRLYRHCACATPFQSHAWLHSWWRSYGHHARLRLVLVRAASGELAAAAPLMRVRHPLPALVPLGGAISDYGDVLLADEHGDEPLTVLSDALSDAARGALIDLREVRPGGAAERLYEQWPGSRRRMDDSVCLELPAAPMGELLARLPTKTQQRLRAKLRKLDALGVQRHVVAPDEVEAALVRLLELHRLQWEGRKVTSEHLRPRFREHLVRAVGAMVRSGDAVVTEFRLDDEVVAVDVTLLSLRLAGGYLYGAHPVLRERKADVAAMLLDSTATHVKDGTPGTLSLLRGNEPYKHHWRPRAVVNQRLLLARRHSAPLLAAALCDAAARRHGKELLRGPRERDRGGRP